MKIAVVGATGVVGSTMLQVLAQRGHTDIDLLPVASAASVGSTINFAGKEHKVVSMQEAISAECSIALFSAGGDTSLQYAPQFAAAGTTVIDNSSAWRMNAEVPLIVPEVNAAVLKKEDRIIANPNCSTIQLVVALQPLYKAFGLKQVVVSTYQSVSGSGAKGLAQLSAEAAGNMQQEFYPRKIYGNVLPHIDDITDNGYTKEELKMMNETRKIMALPHLDITATAVRVPVQIGHSESVHALLGQSVSIAQIARALIASEGLIYHGSRYTTPAEVAGTDDVHIGRMRLHPYNAAAIEFWVVADNLRKGAATNAVQIAELVMKRMA